ncbi:MAG TPA: NAD-glutamate dehydrogenase [Thermoleophilaceae bacterium]
MARMKVEEVDEALLEGVCARIRDTLPAEDSELAQQFVRQYYRWVAPDDLEERSADDLFGAALAHFRLIKQREPGTANVRIYNPDLSEDGWHSHHTAVEIVTDDMPFLIDSVSMELNSRGFGVSMIIHPVLRVRRAQDGALEEIYPPHSDEGKAESVIHVEVARHSDEDELDEMHGHLERVLNEVRASVEDWPQMRERAFETAAALDPARLPVPESEIAEAKSFLAWLADDHFTFLGYRDYELGHAPSGELTLNTIPGSGLGILRQPGGTRTSTGFHRLPPGVRALALESYLLTLTKANRRSTIHRAAYLDYVGVKRFNDDGQVIGERRFLGLYTTTAYRQNPSQVPILRRKVEAILEKADFPPDSHNEKALMEILETHPRDELFQTPIGELFEIVMGILHLGERQRLRLFIRRDMFGRFLSCLVFVPRDRFNTENRRRIESILRNTFQAETIDYTTRVSESVLVRLHYLVYTEPALARDFDAREIELHLTAATRSWADDLEAALQIEYDEETASRLFRRYEDAFPLGYRADWVAQSALDDIEQIEQLPVPDGLAMNVYRPIDTPLTLRAKLYRSGGSLALSDMLPMFENLGVEVQDERPYELTLKDGVLVWIYDFGLTLGKGCELATAETKQAFQEAFIRVWHGDLENDGYNRLVLLADLNWREVGILRAVARYLRQAGTTFSNSYVEQALLAHPDIARLLVELFRARFDPEKRDAAMAESLVTEIEGAIDAVASLDQDRILRQFLDVVKAMLRTNWFQLDETDNEPKAHVSFKLNPHGLGWLPEPRPQFEIWVYSPRTEGVHLRGGPVARGGIRWSDRREDFRTEVLGLMKAQMVKNAVIVPVGAKGGFVVKRPPRADDREAVIQEVIACYSTFISALLDLTDNIVDGQIVPPPGVVRYDHDDPYLVVAADKGTATFSDIANGIAREHNFWLGDAFASGGSSGYDHKKMGITARGAWESVKRHFRELGQNIQEQDFTVAGVGDMSGDVFGNGMLLSPHIRLVGAFNHRHIFIDPDPDPDTSFWERKRLFDLPRSGWDDYDTEKLSQGGGIYPRTAKAVALSDGARAALGIETEGKLTPDELIKALLKAPVDLLWNGGIGTYAKASTETQGDAGDKANDAVRVNGNELRAKVVGEGGNLGFTQRARIEYALHGGRINNDAIDNSAGVDCSDHEVNIKVLLAAAIDKGDLTHEQRDDLLEEMTESVAKSVLKNNYEQTETISMGEVQAPAMLDVHARLIRALEQTGRLDRELEALPTDDELAERKREHGGLTRPELSTLLAYSKIHLYAELLDSNVPEDPYLSKELEAYFPHPLPERYDALMQDHRLRREITATQVVNNTLHGAGSTFVFRLHEETGAAASDIARAYTVAREVFQMRQQWAEIEALDNEVEAEIQLKMLLEGRRLVERAARWLLRNRRRPLDIAATVADFAPGAEALYDSITALLAPEEVEPLAHRAHELRDEGVPEKLATRVASQSTMFSTLDIVEVAAETGVDLETVARVHFDLGHRLQLHWLRDQIVALPRDDRWRALSRAALRDDLYGLHRALTAEVLRRADGQIGDAHAMVESWLAANSAVDRTLDTLADIRVGRVYDLTTLPVAVREVRNLL